MTRDDGVREAAAKLLPEVDPDVVGAVFDAIAEVGAVVLSREQADLAGRLIEVRSTWRPVTLADFASLPGVADAATPAPGVVALTVLPGCEGVGRILENAGLLPLGLEVREAVVS